MNIPENYTGTIFKRFKYGSRKKGIRLCRVPECKKLEDETVNTSLHLFPKNEKLKKLWAIKCRIGVKIPSYFAICNHHFKKSDFYSS